MTTRSQSSPSTSTSAPHLSVPAAVKTASSVPPAPSTRRLTAASAARVSDRSTTSCGMPSTGTRSRPSGRPPASRTAAATAAPRPLAAPVTRTVPEEVLSARVAASLIRWVVDRPARYGQDDRLAAPPRDDVGLRDGGEGVVAPLGEDVRAQRGRAPRPGCPRRRRAPRRRSRARAARRPGRPRPLQRPGRALQPADGVVAVEQDDEAVAERPGLLQHGDVAGVQQVEAAAGGDDGAAGGADPGHDVGGVRRAAVRRRGRGADADGGGAAGGDEGDGGEHGARRPPRSAARRRRAAPAAAEANRSPAPHGSGQGTSGAGTTLGGVSPSTTSAPRPPRVTETAVARPAPCSSRARAVAAVSGAPAWPGAKCGGLGAVRRDEACSRRPAPGRAGAGPRRAGVRRGSAASAARSRGPRATPRP